MEKKRKKGDKKNKHSADFIHSLARGSGLKNFQN